MTVSFFSKILIFFTAEDEGWHEDQPGEETEADEMDAKEEEVDEANGNKRGSNEQDKSEDAEGPIKDENIEGTDQFVLPKFFV